MKLIEKYFAKKNMEQIVLALQSGKITDMATALDIDLNDSEWANIPFTQASEIMQVRVADRVKRWRQLNGEAD